VSGAVGVGVEELFRREYAPMVRALSVSFGDAGAAADCVQDAFVEADRRWATVGDYADPAAWVRRVAINRLLNQRRNGRRRKEILAGVRPIPDADLRDDLIDLRAAIAELPERMRLCLCLHHLAGWTVDDIAEALDVAPGTVKSNLHDARARLRTELEGTRHA
jgi:RNA polymerase sigma-70 factor (ECF subfamily)